MSKTWTRKFGVIIFIFILLYILFLQLLVIFYFIVCVCAFYLHTYLCFQLNFDFLFYFFYLRISFFSFTEQYLMECLFIYFHNNVVNLTKKETFVTIFILNFFFVLFIFQFNSCKNMQKAHLKFFPVIQWHLLSFSLSLSLCRTEVNVP